MAKKPTKQSGGKGEGKPGKRPGGKSPPKTPKTGTPKTPPEEPGVPTRADSDCKEMRLVIIVGKKNDAALQGAERWALNRAAALGGTFHVWRAYDNASPLEHFRAADLTGGRIRIDPNRYSEDARGRHNFGLLLPDFQNCRGRIVELMIFHHGTPVDEAELAEQLLKIFRAIRVPVCRIIWWACNAAVALEVDPPGAWTDSFMMRMGGLIQCTPCGCVNPIELIWPTAGKCYINGPGQPIAAQTNSGKVHRLRWGYRQPDGSLSPRPDPNDPQPTRWPNDRDPPHGQPTPRVNGTVMGLGVTKK
jgi:hypothetical protein